jgi:hypothetical protein
MKEQFRHLVYLLVVLVVATALFILAFPPKAHASSLFGIDLNGIKIVLTDEPCRLSAVYNLPYRGTWTEKGKTSEGCWAVHPEVPFIISYWDDRTVAILPTVAVHPLTGV